MLTVYVLLIFSAVYTSGKPLQVPQSKNEDLYKGLISNLKLLIPLRDHHQHKNMKVKHLKPDAPGQLDFIPDVPFSDIPDKEFVLDDTTNYFTAAKKTIKKDLSQSDASPRSYNNATSSLLQKCKKYLQVEQLRALWEPTLKHSLVAPQSDDHELIISLCRMHLDNIQGNEQKLQVPSVSQSAAKLGVGGSGGVAENTEAEGQGEIAGNAAVSGQGKVAGNKGSKGKGKGWGEKVAFQMLSIPGFNSGNLGINGQGGISGNAGFNGHGGTVGNAGIGGKGGLAGNLGVGGKGGMLGNLGIGGLGGFFGNVGIGNDANQYFDFYDSRNFLKKLFPGVHNHRGNYEGINKASINYPPKSQVSGLGKNSNDLLLELGESSVSESEESPQDVGNVGFVGQTRVAENVAVDGSGEKHGNVCVVETGDVEGKDNVAEAGRDGAVPDYVQQILKQMGRYVLSDIRCHVGSLACGGKGDQIGNLAINGDGVENSRAISCGYPNCKHLNLVSLDLDLKPDRAGKIKWSPLRPAESGGAESKHKEKVNVFDLSKFRPIGGRRDWMVLDEKYEDRLRQYINNQKRWKLL